MADERGRARAKSPIAGRVILTAFVVGLVLLLIWFALDFGGLLPGDSAVLPPEEPATVVPDADG